MLKLTFWQVNNFDSVASVLPDRSQSFTIPFYAGLRKNKKAIDENEIMIFSTHSKIKANKPN